MSLTCSLLGHDFGEPEVEREREERGTEVVTSVREVAVCERCGERRIVSENTEVTTVRTAEEVDADVGATDTDVDGDAADEEPLHPNVDDPIPDDAEGYGDPEDDDAVILTDDLSEREYGEWPAESDQDYRPWDPDSLTEPEDDESEPTIAEVLGADEEEEEDEDDGGATDGDDGAEVIDADAGESFDPGDEPAPAASTVYRCPDCGYAVAGADTSLRPGDSCPSCHSGYLTAERNP